jgi:hypothetical protein
VRLPDGTLKVAAGTMHANLFGHQAQRFGVIAALKRARVDGKP